MKPLYKGDDPTLPDNYRGITVMTCLAKLFDTILNNSVQKYLDENKMINPCQIGFQRKARTVDHMFILRTLIENILITSQNCMFVLSSFKRFLIQFCIQPYFSS